MGLQPKNELPTASTAVSTAAVRLVTRDAYMECAAPCFFDPLPFNDSVAVEADLRALAPHLVKLFLTLHFKWSLRICKRAAAAVGGTDVAMGRGSRDQILVDGRVKVEVSLMARWKMLTVTVFTPTHLLAQCSNGSLTHDRLLHVSWFHMPHRWRLLLERALDAAAPAYYSLSFQAFQAEQAERD